MFRDTLEIGQLPAMTANPQKEWARVRHVVVGGERSERWSLRPWLSAALLVPAVVMLINAQHGGFQRAEMMPSRAAVASKVVEMKATLHSHAFHPGIHGAEAKGLVQPVRAHSEAAAKHNIATDSLTAEPANVKGKVQSAGKVATQAKSKLAAGKEPDNKVVLKMYMESECPACRKFSTTYVKEILNAQGVGDVVDFKIVPWGWGVIQESPTEKQLELNPKTDYSDNVLNHTAQLLPVLRSMENPTAAVPSLLFQCQHGFSEVRYCFLLFHPTHI